MNKNFVSFKKARGYVRKLRLKNKREWREYSKTKRPKFIPSNPNVTYKNEWVSFQDWMGYEYTKGDGTRKYHVNEDFFKTWSHDMAYILGFWFADGYLYHGKRNKPLMGISQMDKQILKDISKAMRSTYPIHEEKTANGNISYRIFIECEEIVKDIIVLGGKYRKSLDMRFPNIPEKFLPDFIRGLWDGDGSAFIDKTNRATSTYTCGSKKFVDKFIDILILNVKLERPSVVRDKRRESAYGIILQPNDSRRLRKYLYQYGGIYLKRKKLVFESMGKIRPSSKDIAKNFLPYDEARSLIVNLGIKTQREWHKYCKKQKRPNTVPSNPYQSYKNNGWVGWKHWLGQEE